MAYIIYFFVILVATTIGALTGMGGGVIIKPLLDMLGDFDVASINLLSSITVFIMALVSISKQLREKSVPKLKIAMPLAIGALIGGRAGQNILADIIVYLKIDRTVIVVQNICLAIVILAVFLYMLKGDRRPTLGLQGVVPALLTGAVLGALSTFLGIGGGPANVALLIFVCSYDIKQATAYSIIIILFAQASKLVSILLSSNLFIHDLSMLPVMVIGAVLGGWTGSHLNKTLPGEKINKAFIGVQVIVFVTCLLNIFNYLNL